MKKIAFWALLCLVFVACRKDQDTDQLIIDPYQPPVIEINVEASVEGIVLDETGAPINEATIKLGGLSTLSNEEGLFIFHKVMMDQSGTLVQVEKQGYFNGSTRFFPKDKSKNFAKITLMDRQFIGKLDAAAGGRLTGPDNIELSFPPNSIVTASNQTYSGDFSVAARWLNPEAENLFEIMPGNLQGLNTEGNQVALISFGMMAVELLDDSGNLLQLGNGQKATLTFPLPPTYRDQAPNEIPLWYFEESTGLWEEEGKAVLQNGTYVGEVAHFSFWNCDDPYAIAQLSGTVLVESRAGDVIPIANAYVKVTTASLGCGYGNTDQDGYFSGAVPRGVPLELLIKEQDGCNSTIYTTTIDPLTTDKDLGDIIVTLPVGDYIEITGNLLDCNSDPLTDGWIQVDIDGRKINHYVDAPSFKLAVLDCDNSPELNVTGRDYNAVEQGAPQSFPITPEVNVGEIIACGNVLEDFVRYTINGEERIYQAVAKKLGNKEFVIETDGPLGLDLSFFYNGSPIGPGTFGQSNVLTFELRDAFDFSSGVPVVSGCSGLDLTCVDFTEFIITAYTGVIGDPVKGSFTGTINLTETGTIPTPYNDVPFSGDFSLELFEF